MYIAEDSPSSLVLIDLYVNENDLNQLLTLDAALKYAPDAEYYLQGLHQLYTHQENLALIYEYSEHHHRFQVVYQESRYVLHLMYESEPYLPADLQVPNREKRDSLLASTDWIDSSSVLCPTCQQSMRSYRQLLRDLFDIVDVRQPVVFPAPPALEFNYEPVADTLYSTDLEAIFQMITVDSSYQASYNLFLQEWRNLNSTANIAVVSTLLDIYCPELKDIVVKHLAQ